MGINRTLGETKKDILKIEMEMGVVKKNEEIGFQNSKLSGKRRSK